MALSFYSGLNYCVFVFNLLLAKTCRFVTPLVLSMFLVFPAEKSSAYTTGTTLGSGDLAVFSWNCVTNKVKVVTFKDLSPGTVVYITDVGWSSQSNSFADASLTNSLEGIIRWTVSSLIPRGTLLEIYFGGNQGTTLRNITTDSFLNSDIVVEKGFTGPDAMSISGDGLFIYQAGSYLQTPFFICGFNNSNAASSDVTENGWNSKIVIAAFDSCLPDGKGSQNGLSNGFNAIGMTKSSGLQGNYAVCYTGPADVADANIWRTRIADITNWSGDNTGTLSSSIITRLNLPALSSNTAIQSVSLNNSTLLPEFDPLSGTYNISVEYETAAISLTVVPEDADASLFLEGRELLAGTASADISVLAGINKIYIEVIAADGISRKIYELLVNRKKAASPYMVVNKPLVLNEGAAEKIIPAILKYIEPEAESLYVIYEINSAPRSGVLYVDANLNNIFDSGEIKGEGDTFTQSDINNEKLKYIHNGDENASDSFVFTVSDSRGNSAAGQLFMLTVNPVNDAPQLPFDSDPAPDLIRENAPAGTFSGVTVSASDTDNSALTYYLTNNGTNKFSIDAITGKVFSAVPFDYETSKSYKITARAYDGKIFSQTKDFEIFIENVNESPTAISLSNSYVEENGQPAVLGLFSASDPDAGDSFSYSLMDGAADNEFFVLEGGNGLKNTMAFNYEAKSSYQVRVRATDNGSLSFEKTFLIYVKDVAEDISSPYITSIDRKQSAAEYTNSASVIFSVTLNEDVKGVDLQDFKISTSGSAAGFITSLSALSARLYEVTVSAVSGNGTIRLDLKTEGTDISDLAGNKILNIAVNAQQYTIDNKAPVIASISLPADKIYKEGDLLDFKIIFDEAIITGTSTYLELLIGSSIIRANYYTAASGSVTFRYIIKEGDADTDGITMQGLKLASLYIRDRAGNDADLSLPFSDLEGILIDAKAPDVPAGLAAIASENQVKLLWQGNSEPDLAGYRVYGGMSSNPSTLLGFVKKGPTDFLHNDLRNGITYYYRISSIDSNGNESSKTANVIAIPKAGQTIIFETLQPLTYGDVSSVVLNASASSGLSVTYKSGNTNIAAISGNRIVIKGAGSTTISAVQPGNAVYGASDTIVRTLTVKRKELLLRVSSSPLISKIYNGTNAASLSVDNYILDGILSGDVLKVKGTASYTDSNVGQVKSISIKGISLDGTDKDNYILITDTGSATGDIIARPLEIKALAAAKIYKDPDPVFSFVIVSGTLAGTDSFTGKLGREAGEGVGKYGIIRGGLSVGNNYNLTFTPADLVISVRRISVVANRTNKVYGEADPPLTFTISSGSLAQGDSFSGSLSRISGESAGEYAIGKSNLTVNANYIINYTGAAFVIRKRELLIKANDLHKSRQEAMPELSISYTGFAYSDNEASLKTKPVISTNELSLSPAGAYPITVGGAESENYTFKYEPGILTVFSGAPSAIYLEAEDFYENDPAGSLAGRFIAFSEQPYSELRYSLVEDVESLDNQFFYIQGNELRSSAPLNYENREKYTVIVRCTDGFGQFTEKRLSVLIKDVNEAPTIDAVPDLVACYTPELQKILLSGISAGPELWQNVSVQSACNNAAIFRSLKVIRNDDNGFGVEYCIAEGQSGSAIITLYAADNGGTVHGGISSSSVSFRITVNAVPAAGISSDNGIGLKKGEVSVLRVAEGYSYSWDDAKGIIDGQASSQLTVRPAETTSYAVTITNAEGCSRREQITLNVTEDVGIIKANNLLSPNGDGINDKLMVENIDMYPGNRLKVFDRAGRMIFDKVDYKNDWDGTFKGGPLSQGTYYYVIDLGPDKKKITGYVSILRD